MKIICQPLGEVQANCYIIIEGENALLIDPGDDYHHLETILKENHAELKAVLLTHAHFDHIAGLDKIVDLYHTDVYCNPKEIEFLRCPFKWISVLLPPYHKFGPSNWS